jgi:hypothetical protein
MGVRIGNRGYQSQAAAEFVEKGALEDFLKALARTPQLAASFISDVACWPIKAENAVPAKFVQKRADHRFRLVLPSQTLWERR